MKACDGMADPEACITTLIREVAAWRKGGRMTYTGQPKTVASIQATNAHPDLQARIAREMEKA